MASSEIRSFGWVAIARASSILRSSTWLSLVTGNVRLRRKSHLRQDRHHGVAPLRGRDHASEPVGNVQAPLGTAATNKERKKRAHNCCYMIPPAPGRPNG